MNIKELDISGAYQIEPELLSDHRGFFTRIFCKNEFQERGLFTDYVQWSISHNHKKNTVRGMHFQKAPYEETKIVSCVQGAVLDVILDLRKDSPTYKKWVSVELNMTNKKMLYIPKGIAHGFKTLTDNSAVLYHISEFYQPECSSGVLYNDKAFSIDWGNLDNLVISEKDLAWQKYED